MSEANDVVEVTVRLSCGSYIASAAGKRASCTMSPEQAAKRLAEKLGLGAYVFVELLDRSSPSLQRYRVSRLAVPS
jgi:hypothetical protein